MQDSTYRGKPVCAIHFHRGTTSRRGLVTVERQAPKGSLKLTGMPVPGCPGYRPSPISAEAARKVAERQPGGAIIVWQDPRHEYAHVYSRIRVEVPA